MTDDERKQFETLVVQLANMLGQLMGHLHIIAVFDRRRAMEIAELMRAELDKLGAN